jgi:flagella basal body P-ring formation protein FlgA
MWVGQVAARQLAAGQALRQSMVRPPQLFRAGAQVKVVAQGPGYAVSSAGQAMSAGAVGQIVRIRMDNGKIVSGTVSDSGTVVVTL